MRNEPISYNQRGSESEQVQEQHATNEASTLANFSPHFNVDIHLYLERRAFRFSASETPNRSATAGGGEHKMRWRHGKSYRVVWQRFIRRRGKSGSI
jgi:hypothetical protein